MKTNSIMAQPKFTDFLSSNRESIRMSTLSKSSLEVISEMVKVAASTNDIVLINNVFDSINNLENNLYNILYSYEHRQEAEASEDMDSDLAHN